MQLEREAIQWHLSFMRYMQYLQPTTWTEYVMDLVERFGVNFDDPMEEIKKVRQTESVREYQATFDRHLTRVSLSQENAISCFLRGLKHDLNFAVKITNPTTLSQVEEITEEKEGFGESEGAELELNQPMEQMEISIHALNGSLGYRTLKVTGYHSKKLLHILVDTCSSHNFIDPELVQKVGMPYQGDYASISSCIQMAT
ncbi:uncharacterized protein [Nicotiana tomentosiformis]|uniref:uncharacterized protein n=1 Tax=Nicotiana tomentosiformis TaxID=4098 RepID=UPI00388C9119